MEANGFGADSPEPAPFVQWGAGRVVAYLDACGARIDIDTGSPRVTFRDGTSKAVRAEIIPHLAGVRGILIDHYFGDAAKNRKRAAAVVRKGERLRIGVPGESAKRTRARLIAEAFKRAEEIHKPVWFLKLTGLAVKMGHTAEYRKLKHPGGVVRVTIDREATHVSARGEGWVPLPRVMTRRELAALIPKTKRKYRQAF